MTIMDNGLDSIDRSLVNLLQTDFPLTPEPYADMAVKLGLTQEDVLHRVEQLRREQIIRIIGPVFNSRTLGYQSTLLALRVPEERVAAAAEIINAHPGVGHDYQRDHLYNLWFTLAIRGDGDLAESLREFEAQIQPEAMIELPALRLFKIRLFFDLEERGNHTGDDAVVEAPHIPVRLSGAERAVVNEVQQQLSVSPRPFDPMAQKVGMETEEFLSHCRSLRQRGIMRRFGASIEHQNAGFVANAMVCWAVPSSYVESAGQRMAAFPEVTHCYERRTSPAWPKYNVFTMIHGKTGRENEITVQKMVQETGMHDYEILRTVREFKKQRVKYRV